MKVAKLVRVDSKDGERKGEHTSAPNDDLASAPHRESGGATTKEEALVRLEAAVTAASMAQESSMVHNCNRITCEPRVDRKWKAMGFHTFQLRL